MHRLLWLFLALSLLAVGLLVSGCGGNDVDVSNEIIINQPPTNEEGKAIRAQIEYWQDGNPLPNRTPITLITTEDRNPPPVYIIQGKQFRIVAQAVGDDDQVIEIDPVNKIGHFTWGAFPGHVVEWFDTSMGWFYHLDAQYPQTVFCAKGTICGCPVSFFFISACADQIP